MCKTHDYLVRVAEECLGIHGQSKTTHDIFKKTDVIEDIVTQHAKSVQEFQSTLNETILQLPPPPTPPPEPEPEPPSKILKLIKYYDKGGRQIEEGQFWNIETSADEHLLTKRFSPEGSHRGGESIEFAQLGKRLEQLSPAGSQRSAASNESFRLGKHFQASPNGSNESFRSGKQTQMSSDDSPKSAETISLDHLDTPPKISPEGLRRSTESIGSIGSSSPRSRGEKAATASAHHHECQHRHWKRSTVLRFTNHLNTCH